MIQIERDQLVMFEPLSTPRPQPGIEVGWRWLGGRVQACAECYCWSTPPPGAPL